MNGIKYSMEKSIQNLTVYICDHFWSVMGYGYIMQAIIKLAGHKILGPFWEINQLALNKCIVDFSEVRRSIKYI